MKVGYRGVISSTTSANTIFNFKRALHSNNKSKTQSKVVAAKKHSEAEKRRRTRINAQYSTLRTILPNLIRDKATVLGESIRWVKELKKAAEEVEEEEYWEDRLSVKYDQLQGEGGGKVVKAMLRCDDRAGLMTEVMRTLRLVNAKCVRVEMVSVGGRTQILAWLYFGFCNFQSDDQHLAMLRMALQKVIINTPPHV